MLTFEFNIENIKNKLNLFQVEPDLKDLIKEQISKETSYLFENESTLVQKFQNYEDVKVNRKTFKKLFQGDWTRKNMFNNSSQYKGLDLELAFLDANKNPNQTISLLRIFMELIKEICRTTQTSNDYNHNFNPRLYFLTIDFFMNTKIISKVKNEEKVYYMRPIIVKDDLDNIIGIKFGGELRDIIRDETLRTIEIYSMFIFNPIFINNLVFSEQNFIKIFIANSIIQYHSKTTNIYSKDNFIDLAIIIKKNKDVKSLRKIFTTKAFIEILEVFHDYLADNLREIDELKVEKCKFLNISVKNRKKTQDYFNEFFPKFIILLYYAGYRYEAIISCMVQIEKFNLEMAAFAVQFKMGLLDCKLSSLPNLPIFNKIINLDKLLFDMAGKINLFTDFKNYNDIMMEKENKEVLNFWIKTGQNEEHITYCILNHFKDKLELSGIGFKKILSKIEEKDWPNQNDFYKYMDQIEEKYIDVIENFFNDKDSNLKDEDYKQYYYINDYVRYESKIKEKLINGSLSQTNDFIRKDSRVLAHYNNKIKKDLPSEHIISNQLHTALPFLKYSVGKIVRWNNYVNNIFHYLPLEQKIQLATDNADVIENISDEKVIVNYCVIPTNEYFKLIGLAKFYFERPEETKNIKYMFSNDSPEFID